MAGNFLESKARLVTPYLDLAYYVWGLSQGREPVCHPKTLNLYGLAKPFAHDLRVLTASDPDNHEFACWLFGNMFGIINGRYYRLGRNGGCPDDKEELPPYKKLVGRAHTHWGSPTPSFQDVFALECSASEWLSIVVGFGGPYFAALLKTTPGYLYDLKEEEALEQEVKRLENRFSLGSEREYLKQVVAFARTFKILTFI